MIVTISPHQLESCPQLFELGDNTTVLLAFPPRTSPCIVFHLRVATSHSVQRYEDRSLLGIVHKSHLGVRERTLYGP